MQTSALVFGIGESGIDVPLLVLVDAELSGRSGSSVESSVSFSEFRNDKAS